MKEFPSCFSVEHKAEFSRLNYDRLKCYLRRDIYEFVVGRKTEDDYFSIDEFNQNRVHDLDLCKKMLAEIILEIQAKGWKCCTSFGDTGLYIFSTEDPPSTFVNCKEI